MKIMALMLALAVALATAEMAAAEKKAPAKPTKEMLRKRYERRTYRDEKGQWIGYRLFKPRDRDAKKKLSLILFLHGAGERGRDNETPLKHVVTRFVEDEIQAKYPCFVVVPQCPMHTEVFRLAGRRGRFGIGKFAKYDAAKGGWQRFKIPVGRYLGGKKRYLTFFTRKSGRAKKVESLFRGVTLRGASPREARPVNFRSRKLSHYGKEGKVTAASVSEDGLTLEVRSDKAEPIALKVELPCTVTQDTVLELEFKTSALGDVHAVGLDDDEQLQSGWWSNFTGGRGAQMTLAPQPSTPMRLVLEMLAALRKEFPVDADRLYVGGLSMGGYGTWDAIMRHPRMFAAAFPICGGGPVSKVSAVTHMPIWVFHGGSDRVVPPQRSRVLVEALKKAGSTKVRYTEYPGVGHNSWDRAAAEPELLAWMFGQKRSGGEKKKPKKR